MFNKPKPNLIIKNIFLNPNLSIIINLMLTSDYKYLLHKYNKAD